MDIKTKDASINLYVSIEYALQTSTNKPVFQTFGASYVDQKDYFD